MQRVLEVLRAVLSRENLDELPEQVPDRSRKGFAEFLRAAEKLPEDTPAAGAGKTAFLPRLFAAEELPRDEEPPRGARRPFLAMLFSGEDLPRDREAAGSGSQGPGRG